MIESFCKHIEDKTKSYVIFDVGSRDCQQSIEFYKTFPNAKIYAFECNPNTIGLCKANIKSYSDRITLIEGAVTDYDGTTTFYPINKQKTKTTWKDGNPGASSLFKTNGHYTIEHYVQDEIITDCHRLDTVMTKHNIPNVDIIWIDLQGAELLALRGLGSCLKNVQYIHTEVTHNEIYSGQVMFPEFNAFMLQNGFHLKNNLTFGGWQEDAIYMRQCFDVVTLVGPHDVDIVEKQVTFTRKNVIGFRNVYLVCCEDAVDSLRSRCPDCNVVSERIFPFSIETVAKHHGKSERNGWYLQQLLKLYAGFVVPGILERYLVIDADTFFLKPTVFYDTSRGKAIFTLGPYLYADYFSHMKRLHPSLGETNPTKSGICHHMMFETKYVKQLFGLVKKSAGKSFSEPFYDIFLRTVDTQKSSGASEYETYFYFMCKFHQQDIIVRSLCWVDNATQDTLDRKGSSNVHFASLHWYARDRNLVPRKTNK